MRATPYEVWRAHDNSETVVARCARGGLRGGEFGDDKPVLGRLDHVLRDGIVVASEGNVAAVAQLEQPAPIVVRVSGLHLLALAHDRFEVFVAPALVALR